MREDREVNEEGWSVDQGDGVNDKQSKKANEGDSTRHAGFTSSELQRLFATTDNREEVRRLTFFTNHVPESRAIREAGQPGFRSFDLDSF